MADKLIPSGTVTSELLNEIEHAAVAAAREILTGRRILEVKGPYGLALTSVEVGNDDLHQERAPGEASAVVSRALSVPMIYRRFSLSKRRVAAFEETGQPLVNILDGKGYRGPYGLALAPALYNNLFRRYPGSDLLQIEHLKRLCTRGIVKTNIDGGVLVANDVGSIVLGQDLQIAYLSP